MNNKSINIKTFAKLKVAICIDDVMEKGETQGTVYVEPTQCRQGMTYVKIEDGALIPVELSELYINYGELALREGLDIDIDDIEYDRVVSVPDTVKQAIDKHFDKLDENEIEYLIEQFGNEDRFKHSLFRIFKGNIPIPKLHDLINMILNKKDFSPILELNKLEIKCCMASIFKLYMNDLNNLNITHAKFLKAYMNGEFTF